MLFCASVKAQVEVDTSYRSYSIKLTSGDDYRVLTFSQDDSSGYVHMNYFANTSHAQPLSSEIPYLCTLWDSARQAIDIRLTSVNVGYPLQYADVLKNHVTAFKRSPEWQAHVKNKGKTLDYPLIKSTMLAGHVYCPLEDLLKEFCYEITGFSTEKHGFLTKEELIELGEAADEVIPVPFMVWIKVEKRD